MRTRVSTHTNATYRGALEVREHVLKLLLRRRALIGGLERLVQLRQDQILGRVLFVVGAGDLVQGLLRVELLLQLLSLFGGRHALVLRLKTLAHLAEQEGADVGLLDLLALQKRRVRGEEKSGRREANLRRSADTQGTARNIARSDRAGEVRRDTAALHRGRGSGSVIH